MMLYLLFDGASIETIRLCTMCLLVSETRLYELLTQMCMIFLHKASSVVGY